uniref:HECT domain-containing protein n=1 Tax=Dicentrarchus labrax TaxID=13489 RepID=A0A8C4ENM1_DICLA
MSSRNSATFKEDGCFHVPMDTEGYSGRQLCAVTNNGKNHLFLVPLQEELDTEPLPYDSAEFARMPQVPCLTCNATMLLQMLALHAENCQQTVNVCPICQKEFPMSVLAKHGSECAERAFRKPVKQNMDVPGPSSGYSVDRSPLAPVETASLISWKTADTPQEAMQLFLKELRQGGVNQPSLLLSLNARDDDEERDSTLISFYKENRTKSQWTAPFNCRIIGDAAVGLGVTRHILSSTISKLKQGFKLNLGNAAVTTMFQGQTDNLVPVLSTSLIESDLIMIAGRMTGHSAIYGGPTLSALSPAVVDAFINSTKEMAASKLCLEDCCDVEHRETIRLVLKEQWNEEESSQITELCLNWGSWKFVSPPDKAILQSIRWPQSKEAYDSDDSDDSIPTGTISAITGFVEDASPGILSKLGKFWTGWEVPPNRYIMEIVKSRGRNHLPTASTCYERIRIPDHYSSYSGLKSDLMECVESIDNQTTKNNQS